MHVTIFHLMIVTVIMALAMAGARLGFQAGGYIGGAGGIVLGTSFGLFVGYRIDRLLNAVMVHSVRRKSTPALRAKLLDGMTESTYVSGLIISTLIERGEPVANFREYIFRQLHSEYLDCRKAGIRNLEICYPDLSARLEGFDPVQPSDEHLAKLNEIEQLPVDG